MIIAIIVALIILIVLILLKVNAFLAFLISSIAAGFLSGLGVAETLSAIEIGLGKTLGSLTIILGFGAVIGKFMAHSGAAKQIANRMVMLFGDKYLKWAMALIGFLVGIPMFFAVGFVILVPLMFSVAKKAKVPFIYLGIPLIASLSVTHGLLPPHPAPAAIALEFGAPMGEVILWGFVLAVPTIIIAGPIFASQLKGIKAQPLKIFLDEDDTKKLPSLGVSLFSALLPVILMMLDAVIGNSFSEGTFQNEMVTFLSQPLTAMLISSIVIFYLLEIRQGESLKTVMSLMEEAFRSIIMILLIIGGAGALNQVFAEAGLSDHLASALKDIQISPIILCWGIAAIIRIAIGSATVAAMTTAGILAPIFMGGGTNEVLLVLATGSGSVIFSHVNDGGFWLFKEYFNLSIKQTLLSWSLMETIISICGLLGCLVLNMFI